ncbi:hypothetical protein MFIFM68171_04926 [Madurella fahalii]|uniref:Uncharacterized protein n=1 Tax=Madurella fahalii TaxID=1157608 RepID=A0ABQ0GAB6_9PEZI
MQLSAFLGAVALLSSSALASPIQTSEHELVARQHTAVSATVTGFHATRNATHIDYAALIKVHPDHPAVLFTHTTRGAQVPEASDFWDSQDPALYFRFNRFLSASGEVSYRLVLSDVHVTGSTINLHYFSPAEEWKGQSKTVYTGPSKFTLFL